MPTENQAVLHNASPSDIKVIFKHYIDAHMINKIFDVDFVTISSFLSFPAANLLGIPHNFMKKVY